MYFTKQHKFVGNTMIGRRIGSIDRSGDGEHVYHGDVVT